MNIKSISLQDFQCYSGDVSKNTFEFNKGLNIIIGDNGAGKSKLFDAFYWVLEGRVYDTSKRDFVPTSMAGKNLISDKAKFKANPGEWVKTEVTLEVETERHTYILIRTYKIQKKEEQNSKDGDKWLEPKNSELFMYKKDIVSRKPITTEKEMNRVIEKILPHEMRPYLWYQGEAVNQLINFKDGQTLSNAINVLSDITRYDSYINIAKKIYSKTKKEYDKESKKTEKANKEEKEKEKTLNYYNEQLEREKEERKEIAKDLTYATEQYDKLLEKIEDAKDLTEYKTKKEHLKKDYKRIKDELQNTKEQFNRKLFNESWLLRNSSNLIDEFEELVNSYEEERQKKLVEKEAENKIKNQYLTRLPINVPEPLYVKRMLEQERCLVCDRPAEKGTEAYKKIEELIEASHKDATDETNHTLKNNYQEAFKALYNNGLSFKKEINKIDNKINEEINKIGKYEEQLNNIKSEIDEIENKLSDYIANSGIQIDESEDIVHAFRTHQKNKEKRSSQLKAKDIKIEELKENIKETEKELRKIQLDSGEVDPSYLKQIEVLEDFKEIALNTKERVYNNLIKNLEDEANKHFKAMTKDNIAIRGKIILEQQPDDSYIPKNVDENGVELTSINDANIVLIKLSVIMAIISAKGKASELYPLISDAPTSRFGELYTMGFYKVVSEVYSQSIIMTYDFAKNGNVLDNLNREIKNLGSVYQIKPNITEEERENRAELETIIKKLA